MAKERAEQAASFPSTHWSDLGEAQSCDPEASRKALGDLLMRYRPALVAYAIRKFGLEEDAGVDAFQSFVLDAVMRRGLILKARAIRGYQFRSYLLSAWHSHLVEQYRRERCQKRMPRGGLTSLEEAPAGELAGESPSCTEIFDLEWAKQVIVEAADRMRQRCEAQGTSLLWGLFECRILKPLCEGAPMVPYGELVTRFGFESPGQARNLLVTAKRTFARHLREVVADYADGEPSTETEVRELYLILGHLR